MPVYNIPIGTKNLQALFPAVDFSTIEEYYIEVKNEDNTTIATSCHYKLDPSCDDNFRLHFLNYLGTIDAINFTEVTKEHEPKSDSFQSPSKYPQQKSLHSVGRMNIKSNNTYTLSCISYNEEDMPFIEEALDSPLAWMEFDGVQGQPANFIPVVILDKKFETKKENDRYEYEVIIEVKLSHERKTLRN